MTRASFPSSGPNPEFKKFVRPDIAAQMDDKPYVPPWDDEPDQRNQVLYEIWQRIADRHKRLTSTRENIFAALAINYAFDGPQGGRLPFASVPLDLRQDELLMLDHVIGVTKQQVYNDAKSRATNGHQEAELTVEEKARLLNIAVLELISRERLVGRPDPLAQAQETVDLSDTGVYE